MSHVTANTIPETYDNKLQQNEANPSFFSENGNNINTIKQTDIILVVGKRGSGKTNITKNLVRMLIEFGCPVIIVDPLGEYLNFKKYGTNVNILEYGSQKQIEDYLKTVVGKHKGFLVIDESDGFFPNRQNLMQMQKTLIHLGRHYGLGVIFVTRRLSNLHTDIVSQAHKLIFFRLSAGADANYLENAQLGELIDSIWSLKKHEYVYYDHENGTDENGNLIVNICEPCPIYTD